MKTVVTPESRFWLLVDKVSIPGCWLWTRIYKKNTIKVKQRGLKRFRLSTRSRVSMGTIGPRAYAWKLVTGLDMSYRTPIRSNCGQWHCINPEHQYFPPTDSPERRRLYHQKQYLKVKLRRKRWFKDLATIKEFNGCVICAENQSCCLQFHHIDPKSKKFQISAGGGYPKQKLLDEIAKCTILCANCHWKIHAGILNLPQELTPVLIPANIGFGRLLS